MIPTDVPHLARYLMEKHGLTGWSFKWDHARRRAGACHHGRKVISLSKHYVTLNCADRPEDVLDTILHEVAHALVGPSHGHDEVWRAKATEVGAKPERCYSSKVAMPQGKYAATCGGCTKEYRYHKRSKGGTYRYCARCGPERGRLTFRCGPPPGTTTPTTPTATTRPRPERLD